MTPKEFERLDREERIAALKYVVLLFALHRRDHLRFIDLIDLPGAKIASSLAANIPQQILWGIPRPPSIVIKNYCVWKFLDP